jgi:hypothetical protein
VFHDDGFLEWIGGRSASGGTMAARDHDGPASSKGVSFVVLRD